MEKQQVMEFGEVDLNRFVDCPRKLEEGEKKSLDQLITETEATLMDVEILPLKMLKLRQLGCRRINMRFLDGSREAYIPQLRGEVKVPLFGVFKLTETGFAGFQAEISIAYQQVRFKFKGIPDIFGRHLQKSFGILSRFAGDHLSHNISEQNQQCLANKYGSRGMTISTQFLGIIPLETKKKIASAREIFDDQIFLISEVEADAWECKVITDDPLIVGIFEGKTYLVDHFDTTSIENFVLDEFMLE